MYVMKKRLSIILIIIFISIFYFILSATINPSDVFFSCDSGMEYIQLKSFIHHKWKDTSLYYPGATIDEEGEYFPLRYLRYEKAGKFYSQYPISFSFLSSFLYKHFGTSGLHIFPILSSVLLLTIVYFISKNIISNLFIWAVLLVGLCSLIIFYSMLFWNIIPGVAIGLLGTFLVMRNTIHSKPLCLFLSGLILGIATWIRTDSYIVVASSFLAFSIISLKYILKIKKGYKVFSFSWHGNLCWHSSFMDL